ncbi:MAG: ATP-binding protein [Clostridia bacterium]|nr:ATP-binding protein [Clostridia bacterium]
MDSRILAAVAAELEAKRALNEQEENRRKEEIASRHPDIQTLIDQRHEMVMRSIRGVFGASVGEDPEKRMQTYNEKIASLLESRGYPRDYLSPVCSCKLCGDLGYTYENSIQKPCECLKQHYLAHLSQEGEIAQGEHTFENYDASRFPEAPLPGTDVTQREYMEIVKKKCQVFSAQVPFGSQKTLLLHGGSGLGKTYLLQCIGNAARSRGVDTLYTSANDLFMALKNACFSRTGETADEYFDAPLLLIDDLGVEPMMENITVEQMYNLINSRLSHGLYTAITTNLSRTELEKRYTERLSSRLLDARTGMAIPFLGKDIRLIK